MNDNNLPIFAGDMLRDITVGTSCLAIVLLVNIYFFMKILIWFTRKAENNVNSSANRLMGRFMVAALLMCLTQVGSILFWAGVIYKSGLIDNLRIAMLFAGSCYTTLGIFPDVLPKGWQSIAFYIAFSGLFAFAIATAAMISMLSTVSRRAYEEALKNK